MCGIILVTIFGKFKFLILDQGSIGLLQIIDFDIETVDVALEF